MERQASAILDITATLEGEPPDLGPHSSPDGAVTLMFTELEDAAGIADRLGEPAFEELLREHAGQVERIVGAHDGDVVKSRGDGFMIAFRSAHAGLRSAIELQRELSGRGAGAGGTQPRVRIGVHSGFVIADSHDFFGRNVVLAARIAELAGGGEILASSTIVDYTSSDPSFAFEPRGEHHFRGVLGEHRIFALEWGAG